MRNTKRTKGINTYMERRIEAADTKRDIPSNFVKRRYPKMEPVDILFTPQPRARRDIAPWLLDPFLDVVSPHSLKYFVQDVLSSGLTFSDWVGIR